MSQLPDDEALYRTLAPSLDRAIGVAGRRLRVDERPDFAQEVRIRVTRDACAVLRQLDAARDPYPYLLIIARRTLADWLRHSQGRTRRAAQKSQSELDSNGLVHEELHARPPIVSFDSQHPIGDSDADVSEIRLLAAEVELALRAELSKLPQNTQDLLAARFADRHGLAARAVVTGRRIARLYDDVSAACRELRGRLEVRGVHAEDVRALLRAMRLDLVLFETIAEDAHNRDTETQIERERERPGPTASEARSGPTRGCPQSARPSLAGSVTNRR